LTAAETPWYEVFRAFTPLVLLPLLSAFRGPATHRAHHDSVTGKESVVLSASPHCGEAFFISPSETFMNTPGRRASLRFLIAFAAVAVLGTAFAAPARSAEPYDINVVISETGPGAFLGQAGVQSLNAIEKLVNRSGGIHGQPIHFVIADDQTSPSVAVQLATGLIAKGVPVVLGSAVGATCFAMIPLFKNGPVNYCFAPVIHPVAPSYVFSAGASTRDLSLAGLRWARLHGIKKIAFLDATDTTGQDGETVSKANLELPEFAGLQLVANEHFNVTDINVNAQLARIKASGAELLYAQTVGTPFGTVLKNAYDSGLDVPILTNAGNINYTQMTQY
jgi:branched-chain amino acid transport system substrate-binding protein